LRKIGKREKSKFIKIALIDVIKFIKIVLGFINITSIGMLLKIDLRDEIKFIKISLGMFLSL
jgi:hypothetical protein